LHSFEVFSFVSKNDFLLNANGEIRLADFRFCTVDEKRKLVKKDFFYFAILLIELALGRMLDDVRAGLESQGDVDFSKLPHFDQLPAFLQNVCSVVSNSERSGLSSAIVSIIGKNQDSKDDPTKANSKTERKRKSEAYGDQQRESKKAKLSSKQVAEPENVDLPIPPDSLDIKLQGKCFYVEKSSDWKLRKCVYEGLMQSNSFSFNKATVAPHTARWDHKLERQQVICDNLIRKQECLRNGCPHLHPAADVKSLPRGMENSKKVCVKFVQGNCDTGSVCPDGFYHWTLDEEMLFLVNGCLPNMPSSTKR
jgi:hypothetical protein